MPIYEYEALNFNSSCKKCLHGFEFLQKITDEPLTACPDCGSRVRKIVSWCRAAVVETSDEHAQVNRKIAAYEKEGMWSHAAELADTHSEKIQDNQLKMRAIDNYEKAGYAPSTLEKHAKSDNIKSDSQAE